jgi:CubicO group peptidase (beta-lactamase class C family)
VLSNHIDLRTPWAILQEAVATWAFPGAVACVASSGEIIGEQAFGRFTYDEGAPPVTKETRYDLASVSKTMVAWAVMRLVEQGRVDLDTAAATYLPQLRGRTEPDRFTIRQLLCHSGGLPSDPELHQMYPTADGLWTAIFNMPQLYRPGTDVRYTSMGYMLLGLVVEAVSGQSLDSFLTDRLFGPLEMASTGFCPRQELREKIAPTEFSPRRGRVLQGEVHDENADVVGGVAGHTGVFSTARDVARFGAMLAGGGRLGRRRLMQQATVRLMFEPQTRTLRELRALGWLVNDSMFGRGFPRTIAHTGFTGTSLCIMPETGLTAVLLSNRVQPTRANEKIRKVRAAFHEALAAAFAARRDRQDRAVFV